MQVIGHRGCRGLLPENTIVSFKEAIRLGVDAIELDVVLSKDLDVVVSHEPFMSKITCLKPDGSEISVAEDQQINLFQMSYKDIKTYDCGLKGNYKFPEQRSLMACKPLLIDAIQECEAYIQKNNKEAIDYIIEIKSVVAYYGLFYPQPDRYVDAILRAIDQCNPLGKIILKSFDVNILNEIKKKRPDQKISLLINREESIEEKLNELDFIPEILGPYFELLDREIVQNYKELGFEIFPWTINAESSMKSLIALGVDGIITDYPNKLLKLLVVQ